MTRPGSRSSAAARAPRCSAGWAGSATWRPRSPGGWSGKIGIGHTRWATHGPATEQNAHPQSSADGRITVVHNGIIDNAAALRDRLAAQGVTFTSETDTEIIAHLVARSAAATLEAAVLEALSRITGTYAILVMDERHPDRLVAARNGSPLILGVGDREMFVASDLSAIVRHTASVVHLDDGELATVTAGEFRTFSPEEEDTAKSPTTVDLDIEDVGADGHRHYMYKEILEQPSSIERMLQGRLDDRFGTARLDGLNLGPRELRGFRRVKILGCGSAYYAGQIGAAMIEELARIPADAEPASEFRYRNPIIEPDTLYVAVSQSGETADTAFAVREVQRKGGQVIGLVNVVGSTIARENDGGIYLHAGPEVAVASTKALTHMVIGFAMLALALGRVRDLSIADGQRIIAGLRTPPRADRGDPQGRGQHRQAGRRAGRGAEPVLHRPGPRLPGRPRGRPEVQGDLLPARRGLPGQRAQARAAGPDRRVPADRGDRARRRAHRPQPGRRAADPGPQGPGRDHHPPGRRGRRAVARRRPAASWCPRTSASSTRSCSPSRCSCWPTTRRWSWAMTSTSRVTWPSRSPWSSRPRRDSPVTAP